MSGPAPRVSDDDLRRASETWPADRPLRELAATLGMSEIWLQQRRQRLGISPRVPTSAARSAGQRASQGHEDRARNALEQARASRSAKSKAGTLRRSPEATAKAVATTDERHPDLRETRPKKMRTVLRKKLRAEHGPNYMKFHMKRARAANVENRFSPAWRASRSVGEKERAARLGRTSHYFAIMKRLETVKKGGAAALTKLRGECQTAAARSLVESAIDKLGGRPSEVNRAGIIADLRAGVSRKEIRRRWNASPATISRIARTFS